MFISVLVQQGENKMLLPKEFLKISSSTFSTTLCVRILKTFSINVKLVFWKDAFFPPNHPTFFIFSPILPPFYLSCKPLHHLISHKCKTLTLQIFMIQLFSSFFITYIVPTFLVIYSRLDWTLWTCRRTKQVCSRRNGKMM